MIRKLILLPFLFLSVAAFSQNISKEAWLEDLEAYKTGLQQNHIDLYNKISKADFEKELNQIKKSLDQKSGIEVSVELMRLTRKIGDGHTAVSFRKLDMHNFPFELQNFDGKWRVTKIAKKYNYLLGQTLVQVDGNSIETVAEKVGEVAQFVENKYSYTTRTAQYLTLTELLYGLKLTKEKTKASLTFQDDNGKLITEKMTGLNGSLYENESFSRLTIGVPEIEPPDNPQYENFWYAPITGTKGLYIHFESYPAFEDMMTIGEKMVTYISQNNIRQLVIDLRNNGGGDLYTGLVLAYALNLADPVDWKSGVYVLCDNVTFSAATSNTALFRELLNARIVGEPTGSNPTGYQDMDTFELPHSKLVICYSKRIFRIQETITEGVQPDVFIQYNWNSFSNGKDNILDWVISDIKTKSN